MQLQHIVLMHSWQLILKCAAMEVAYMLLI